MSLTIGGAGWKKDRDHILWSFYHYNHPSHKEEDWWRLKTRFFEFLGQHQEEWRAIKENKPLQYMPIWKAVSTPSLTSNSLD